MKVQFELRIAPFADHIVQVPAEFLKDVDHLAKKTHRVDRIFNIVPKGLSTGPNALTGCWVIVECLDWLSVLPFHDEEFRLYTGVHRVALIRNVLYGSFQCTAWTQLIGSSFPPQVRKHPGAGFIPRTDHEAVEIGQGDLVCVGGPQFGNE